MLDFDREARVFVNGIRFKKYHNGHPDQWDIDHGNFHKRWIELPLVRQSIVEGWDKDMRQHLVGVIRALLTRVVQAMPPADLVALKGQDVQAILSKVPLDRTMPEAALVDHWRRQAQRYREADGWRAANPDALRPKLDKSRPIKRVDAKSFADHLAKSRNAHLHRGAA